MSLKRIFSATRLKVTYREAHRETIRTLQTLVLLMYLLAPPLLMFLLISSDMLITKVSISAGFTQEINPLKQALNTQHPMQLLFWMYVLNIASTLFMLFIVVFAAISKSARDSIIVLLFLLMMWVVILVEAWVVYNNIEELRPGLTLLVAKHYHHN